MQKEEIQDLVKKYLNDTATVAELEQLSDWYRKTSDENVEWFTEVANEEELLKALMYANIEKEVGLSVSSVPKKYKLWPRIIGVAAAVAAIVFGIWFYTSRHLEGSEATRDLLTYANDIAPGKNTATMKIGDGEAITLSDKQTGVVIGDDLRYNDNSVVSNSTNKRSLPYGRDDARARMLTVTTPRGGTYQVTLPDGTKVWLNAASVLTYTMPLNERGGVRLVELSGEAYFEVFRNKLQPFVVTTKNLTTTVLGTHFNISAYDDENSTKATLLEGSVKVSSSGLTTSSSRPTTPSSRGKRSDEGSLGRANSRDLSYRRDDVGSVEDGVILKPNQQAVVRDNSRINVTPANTEETIAWKNGKFGFDSEEMGSVMRKVARWYNVEVVFSNEALQKEKVSGSVSRFANISTLLHMLEETGGTHFKVEGKKVTLSK